MPKAVLIFMNLLLLTGVAVAGCAQPAAPPEEAAPPEPEAPPLPVGGVKALSVSSPAFEEGGKIPVKYACDGENISPPLGWSGVPAGTNSLALIMDDPDAPGGAFTHWVLFNLLPYTRELPEGVPPEGELPSGALQGKNDFGKVGYFGPCPPQGAVHHYRFTLYVLDQPLDLGVGVSKEEVLGFMEGHIFDEGRLIGTYQR